MYRKSIFAVYMESFTPKRPKRINPADQIFKSVNLARGLFYIFVAGYLLLNKGFQESFGQTWCYALGIPAALYGCFRTYRSFTSLNSKQDDNTL